VTYGQEAAGYVVYCLLTYSCGLLVSKYRL